jgi:hypothetical protein
MCRYLHCNPKKVTQVINKTPNDIVLQIVAWSLANEPVSSATEFLLKAIRRFNYEIPYLSFMASNEYIFIVDNYLLEK